MAGPASTVRFGVFRVDLESRELFRGGRRLRLQEQPFQALLALTDRPGAVITREELRNRLWPSDTHVDFERGLNKAINRLREALGDDASNPRFIETVPQRGYRFLADVEKSATASPATAGIHSLAVLPLDNLSASPEHEYFSDGMTDEIIGEISKIASLRVVSRTSVMRYKGRTGKFLPEIARELNVDAILEGTVQQAGGRVRITAQLIRAHDDRHLWSGKYERELTDVLALQGEVAQAVAREIRVKLTPEEQASLSRTRPVIPAAYHAFLNGNYFLHRGMLGIPKSIDHFTEAVRLDPGHADSHAGLAEALILAGIFGMRPTAEALEAARAAALKAISLDDANAAAHNALADVKKCYDWDLAGAEREYLRALELNPSHLMTRLWYAENLARMKRYDEAVQESLRAIELDPVSPVSHNAYAMILFRARRYDDSIRAAERALELDPNFVNAMWWLGLSHAGLGDYERALECLRKAVSLSPSSLFRALLGHVYGRAGRTEEARRLLEELHAMAAQRYVSPVDFAIVHAGLGEADATFASLERAYRERVTRVHELPSMYFDAFRSDPRYADLLRRTGLPW